MRSHRLTMLAGLAAGLVGLTAAAAVVTASEAEQPSRPGVSQSAPLAVAGGDGGGATLYPGLVSVHFDRTAAALAAASTKADIGDVTGAGRSVQAARAQIKASWAGTRYLIRTTPPPPPPADRAGAGGDGGGAGYAAPPATAQQFFSIQHDLAAASAGLLSARPVLNAKLVAALQANATLRDRAIEYIHTTEPPAPPPADDSASAGGAPVATTIGSVMPTVVVYLDDEIVALKGTIATNKKVLPADVVTALRSLITKAKATETKINTYWPPLPADD
ncbi:hypothetical protein [Nocardioides conyzicola]|uniref:DUF4439 domain-containing protein n=1 Tax=Nocardioides conyzicola TaxID=1651781 RepID=A0ABP8WZ80_9ACTN